MARILASCSLPNKQTGEIILAWSTCCSETTIALAGFGAHSSTNGISTGGGGLGPLPYSLRSSHTLMFSRGGILGVVRIIVAKFQLLRLTVRQPRLFTSADCNLICDSSRRTVQNRH